MAGSRSASIVLPAPGGPSRNRWCPPAAATSTAVRAECWPTTSARSCPWSCCVAPMLCMPVAAPVPGMRRPASSGSGRPCSSGSSSGTGSSVRTAISCRRLRTPSTDTPGTSEASAAAHSGTTTCSYPASAAASTAGSTPRTGRTRPSRPSSPIITMSASTRGSMRSEAPSAAQAMARSNPLPLFGTEAGLRPTVSFFCGHSPPELTTAARTRSLLSVRLLSGRPTRVNAATPGSRSAWTSTTTPSTPTSATEHVRANPIRPPPARAPRRGRRGRAAGHRRRRCGRRRVGLLRVPAASARRGRAAAAP